MALEWVFFHTTLMYLNNKKNIFTYFRYLEGQASLPYPIVSLYCGNYEATVGSSWDILI